MYRIRKKFKFEMAHRLNTSYSKECQDIHGHSYVLEVIIDSMGLNEDGMVIDFKLLKSVVNDFIINDFDHALVISNINKKDYEWVKYIPSKKVVTDYNPTAENMVKDFYNRLYAILSVSVKSFYKLTVRLHETDTGYAEYTKNGR